MNTDINPNAAEVYTARGRAKHALDKPYGAIADFDTAIHINRRRKDKDADAYTARGRAKHALGDLKSAIADFDTAIDDINPDDAKREFS